MRELLAELIGAIERRLPCVYCMVVETRGSTPQKAGAAMLVYADGTQAGTLGGGCVEAEVKRRALLGLNAAGRVEVFSFNLDDDYGWDDGLICGGRMTVLAHPLHFTSPLAGEVGEPQASRVGGEPAATPHPPLRGDLPRQGRGGNAACYYRTLHDLAERGEGFTECVVVGEAAGLPIGDRCLFDAAGAIVERLEGSRHTPCADGNGTRSVPATVVAQLAPLAGRPQPAVRVGVAYLPTLPRVTVFLVGGGHVGQAVARLASDVGFDVWVLDDREKFASPERFPTASRRFVGDIGTTLRDLAPTLTRSTFALILTRGHNHDEEALYHLANTACGYVGMIGSRRKIRMIFEDLAAKGIPAEALERVHAPLGYNIGSQTVPEIAVSIVAGLIACRNLGTGDAARQSWTRQKGHG